MSITFQRYNGSEWVTESEGGGGGISNHASLTNLAWTNSKHTGSASHLAGFDSLGASSEYDEANYFLKDGSRAMTGNLLMPNPALIGSGSDLDLIELDGTLSEVTVNGDVISETIELNGDSADVIKTSGEYTITSSNANLADLSRTTSIGTISTLPVSLINTRSVLSCETDYSGGGTGSRYVRAIQSGLVYNGDVNITGALETVLELQGINGTVDMTSESTITSGSGFLAAVGVCSSGLAFDVINNASWSEGANAIAADFIGTNITVSSSPTIVAGTPTFTYYGTKLDVSTSTDANSTNYGIFLDSNGADTNYGLFVNSGDLNIINGSLRLGDTTTPTERLEVNGNILATTGNVYKVGAAVGQTGTFTFGGGSSGDIATMTFTGGILTGATTVP